MRTKSIIKSWYSYLFTVKTDYIVFPFSISFIRHWGCISICFNFLIFHMQFTFYKEDKHEK